MFNEVFGAEGMLRLAIGSERGGAAAANPNGGGIARRSLEDEPVKELQNHKKHKNSMRTQDCDAQYRVPGVNKTPQYDSKIINIPVHVHGKFQLTTMVI